MAGGKTTKDKAKDKAKADGKKKLSMKDILAKKQKGGKGKKKKWSKTKTKEKLNNAVFLSKVAWDKISKDIATKEAYITPSLISEKLKLNCSVARQAIQELCREEKIAPYNGEHNARFPLYSRTEKFQKECDAKPVEVVEKKGKKAKK
jgi:small subunit ribosomal protein S25e